MNSRGQWALTDRVQWTPRNVWRHCFIRGFKQVMSVSRCVVLLSNRNSRVVVLQQRMYDSLIPPPHPPYPIIPLRQIHAVLVPFLVPISPIESHTEPIETPLPEVNARFFHPFCTFDLLYAEAPTVAYAQSALPHSPRTHRSPTSAHRINHCHAALAARTARLPNPAHTHTHIHRNLPSPSSHP